VSDRGNIVIIGEKYTADILRELLEKDGYMVEAVDRGEEALTTINAVQPNLVMLDSQLPDTNPFTLCETLKNARQTFDIPVIFMTTDDDAEGRVKGVEFGDDLITKPLEKREVLARVERQVTVSKVRMALRESEAKFRSVMESAIDAIISSDVSGNIRAWNSAATALFGFSEEEAIGQPIELIIPERFHRRHREGLNRVSSGGPSRVIGTTVELAAVKKNGNEFPVELSLATWFLDDERYFTGIIRDISERKQAEQKFRSVTESAIDAIISADHNGKIVSWNNAATRILGYTPDEAVGEQLELIIPERFHDAHREGMARVTTGGESRVIGSTVELFACTKSGEEVPIELSLSTWEVRNDRYYTGIIRDIGERKRAEEELRMSEQALRESTLELRNKNEILEQTLNRLQEMQHQLIIQEKMASLGKLSAGMAHELNNPTAATQRSATQLLEMLHQLQDAHWEITELNLSKEQLNTVMALDHDDRKGEMQLADLDAMTRSDRELEMENWLEKQGLEKSWELAPALVKLGYDKSKLRLLVHDFNERQFSAVIKWLGCTHAIYSLLSEINIGTGRIAATVKALKTYTYMDKAPIQSVDMNEGLDNTLIIFQNKLKSGITVFREYAEDLPIIQAYGSELNQVWTNIIDNAIDAMSGEGILILRTRVEDQWVIIEIEDNGPGIPRAIQANIFDPFFTTKPPGEGTGLGLNISHNIIVKKHQGQVYVSSKPGKTCFTVRLPIVSHPDKKSPRGRYT
jgi:PAS domain S-box-containing protein